MKEHIFTGTTEMIGSIFNYKEAKLKRTAVQGINCLVQTSLNYKVWNQSDTGQCFRLYLDQEFGEGK